MKLLGRYTEVEYEYRSQSEATLHSQQMKKLGFHETSNSLINQFKLKKGVIVKTYRARHRERAVL